jgi:hypothetical protein
VYDCYAVLVAASLFPFRDLVGVYGSPHFSVNTHGDWANQGGLSTELVSRFDRSVPSRVGSA